MPRRTRSQRGPPHHPHRLRRAVPHTAGARNCADVTARAGPEAPHLGHGPQDHHRLRHAVQQRPGDDRSPLALRRADGPGRCRRPSAEHRPLHGRVHRQLRARPAQPLGHVLPHPIRRHLARPRGQLASTRSISPTGHARLRSPAHATFSRARPRPPGRETGGTLPAVLNAANEVAVAAFLDRRIPFPAIWETVARTMDAHETMFAPTWKRSWLRMPGLGPMRQIYCRNRSQQFFP